MKIYLGLICKVGTPRKVLSELVALNVPGGDIFLLFGPIDILIEFPSVTSLDEYMERWLNSISLIGEDEGLITKALTFLVGQGGPAIHTIPFAVVFITTRPPRSEAVRRALQTIPEVLTADYVLGPYDIICPVRAADMKDLERVVLTIQTHVVGIERTMTCLVKEVY